LHLHHGDTLFMLGICEFGLFNEPMSMVKVCVPLSFDLPSIHQHPSLTVRIET
jgi:hypothetical protein